MARPVEKIARSFDAHLAPSLAKMVSSSDQPYRGLKGGGGMISDYCRSPAEVISR